jgi:hypothetical protein
MSADNGVYILQSKDGFRVAHRQGIENIYWWPTECCGKRDVVDGKSSDGFDISVCKHCGKEVKWEERTEINPETLKSYFGNSKVYKTRISALTAANKLYKKIISDPMCPICEYGISFINGWEKKTFPK